ncbi:two-component system response regulator [Sodalinema gerasimenkoae]|uniref:two-component system response regulator n=1 Tax=Sodalinema gerasimenkoae TaxID=2862348 RepID=UPI0013585BFA|nr:GGDEF domain-containing response regulator [Sodalinema gerasimenkoae]
MSSPERPSKGNILIVDDTPANLELLNTILTRAGYEVCVAVDGTTGLEGARYGKPDLVLLDIMMPGMNGYDVCRFLKDDQDTRDIPVIFISALDDALDKVKAFTVGGTDYISKPFQFKEVLARVQNQLMIRDLQQRLREQNKRLQKEIGDRALVEAEVRQLNEKLEERVRQRTAELEATNTQLQTEISQRKRVQEQLMYMALHDSLTGLPNRVLLMEKLEAALTETRKDDDYRFAVLFIDCDRFKVVNDSLGHLTGDRLLSLISDRLELCLRPVDTLFRLGGDEFTILLNPIQGIDNAIETAETIQKQLMAPFHVDGHEVFIGASIGIVLGTSQYTQPEHLLRDADAAMYCAKDLGKGRYRVFDSGMHDRAVNFLQLETNLRRALERGEFKLNYQPIVDLQGGRVVGFEALLRWHHPERGQISPAEFIPAAEETGLIVPIGEWVLRQSCSHLKRWQCQYPHAKELTISVNISVKQFAQIDLLNRIDDILQDSGLDGEFLKLEITESTIVGNYEVAKSILEQLKNRNIQLSIDDFGTGYSSLSHLHRLPVDILKIDRSFVDPIDEDNDEREIVQAIVTLAHSLNMKVIAEGVETAVHVEQLRNLGCEYGQGYYFSKPLTAEAATALLAQKQHW